MPNTGQRPLMIELDLGETAVPIKVEFFLGLCAKFGINYLRLTGSLRIGGCNPPSKDSDFDFSYRRAAGLPYRLNALERHDFSERVKAEFGKKADMTAVFDLLKPGEDPFTTWNYLVQYAYDASMCAIFKIRRAYEELDRSLGVLEKNRSYFPPVLYELQREVRLLRGAYDIGLNCRTPMRKWPASKYATFPWREFAAEALSSVRKELYLKLGRGDLSAAEAVWWERLRSERSARPNLCRESFSKIAAAELKFPEPQFPPELRRRLLLNLPVLS